MLLVSTIEKFPDSKFYIEAEYPNIIKNPKNKFLGLHVSFFLLRNLPETSPI